MITRDVLIDVIDDLSDANADIWGAHLRSRDQHAFTCDGFNCVGLKDFYNDLTAFCGAETFIDGELKVRNFNSNTPDSDAADSTFNYNQNRAMWLAMLLTLLDDGELQRIWRSIEKH